MKRSFAPPPPRSCNLQFEDHYTPNHLGSYSWDRGICQSLALDFIPAPGKEGPVPDCEVSRNQKDGRESLYNLFSGDLGRNGLSSFSM